jgi:hypothetical protein
LGGSRDFSLLHIIQTGSIAHLTSYTVGTGGFFVELRGRSMKLTTDFHLVLGLRTEDLYLDSPTYLHGMVLNSLSTM